MLQKLFNLPSNYVAAGVQTKKQNVTRLYKQNKNKT